MLGILRKIDELGRVVIPKQIRFDLGITNNDSLEISSCANGVILMRKVTASCIFCNNEQELHIINNKYICSACAAAATRAMLR